VGREEGRKADTEDRRDGATLICVSDALNSADAIDQLAADGPENSLERFVSNGVPGRGGESREGKAEGGQAEHGWSSFLLPGRSFPTANVAQVRPDATQDDVGRAGLDTGVVRADRSSALGRFDRTRGADDFRHVADLREDDAVWCLHDWFNHCFALRQPGGRTMNCRQKNFDPSERRLRGEGPERHSPEWHTFRRPIERSPDWHAFRGQSEDWRSQAGEPHRGSTPVHRRQPLPNLQSEIRNPPSKASFAKKFRSL
jgi:hypothetical protein